MRNEFFTRGLLRAIFAASMTMATMPGHALAAARAPQDGLSSEPSWPVESLGGVGGRLSTGDPSALEFGARPAGSADVRDRFHLSGSFRTRYSRLWNQFRPGLDDDDQALSLRTLLLGELELDRVSLVGELQDARAYLTDEGSGVSTIVVNAVEVLQAFASLDLDARRPSDLELRLGRQTMELGSGRLVFRHRFRNTIQNYTGLTARWASDDSTLFGFYTLPVQIEPNERDALLDNEIEYDEEDFDQQFWGLHYTRSDVLPGTLAELYFLGLNERDDPAERSTADRELFTPGLRLLRPPRPHRYDFECELVGQFGTRRATTAASDTDDLNVRAYFAHAALGYTFDADWSPRLAVEFDYGSGESGANDSKWTRFDSLFGQRRVQFGPTGIFGLLRRENLLSYGPRFSLEPNERWDAFVSWRINYLAQDTDSFGQGNVVDPTGSSGDFAGHQLELRTRYWVIPHRLQLELGGALFLEGDFLQDAPNADPHGDPAFLYADLTYTF